MLHSDVYRKEFKSTSIFETKSSMMTFFNLFDLQTSNILNSYGEKGVHSNTWDYQTPNHYVCFQLNLKFDSIMFEMIKILGQLHYLNLNIVQYCSIM